MPKINPRHKKLIRVALLYWLGIVALGWLYFILPIILSNVACEKLTTALKREANIRRVTFNPFRLRLTVEGITVQGPDGAAFFACEQLSANVRIGAITGAALLDDLQVHSPHLRIIRTDETSFNFSDLLIPDPNAPAKPPADPDAKPLEVAVDTVIVSDLHLRLSDRLTATEHCIAGVQLQAHSVTEDIFAAMAGHLEGRVNDAGLVVDLTTRDQRIALTMALTDSDLTHYLPYVPLPPNLQVRSLRLDLAPTLAYNSDEVLVVSGDLGLRDIVLAEGDSAPFAQLPSLSISAADSRPLENHLHLSGISIISPEFSVSRAADSSINLLRAVIAESAESEPAPAEPAESAESKPWHFQLDTFDLNGATVSFADDAADAPFATSLNTVSLQAQDLSNTDKPGTIAFSAGLAAGGKSQLQATLIPVPFSCQVSLDLDAFPIAHFSPYFKSLAAIDVADGTVAVQAKLDVDSETWQVNDAELTVADLKILARQDQRELFAFEALRISGVSATASDATLSSISLAAPRIHAVRLEDGSIDWQALFPAGEAKSEPAATPVEKSSYIATIAALDIVDCNLALRDRSVSPDFATTLSLNVAGKNLSTRENSAGSIKAQLDGDGGESVTVSATLTPIPFAAEFAVAAEGLALPRYGSYYADKIGVALTAGDLACSAEIVLPELAVSKGQVTLRNLRLAKPVEDSQLLLLPELSIAGIAYSAAENRAAIEHIGIMAPKLSVGLLSDGGLDWPMPPQAKSPLALETAPEEASEEAGAPPIVEIAKAAISGAEVAFRDSSVSPAFSSDLTIHLDVTDFSTAVDQKAKLSLTLDSAVQETIKVDGSLAVSPLSAQADIRFANVAIPHYAAYFQAQLSCHLASATLGGHASVAYPDLHVTDAGINLADLELRSSQDAEPFVRLASLVVAGVDLALEEQNVKVGKVALDDGQIMVKRLADGSIDLQELFATSATEEESDAPPASEPGKPWQASLAEFAISGLNVDLNDASMATPAKIGLRDIGITVRDYSTTPATACQVSVDSTLASGGRIQVSGSLTPEPLYAELETTISDLEIQGFEPYAQTAVQLVLKSGAISVDGRLSLSPENTTWNGNLGLATLAVAAVGAEAPFASWDALDVTGVRFALEPLAVAVNEVALRKPIIDFVHHPSTGTMNQVLPATAEATPAVSEPAPDGDKAEPMKLGVATFLLEDATFGFRDETVSPAAGQKLSSFSGTVRDISLGPNDPASFDFKGTLGQQGALSIVGKATPALDLTLAVRLDGLDMPQLTPYTGKFAGVGIRQGKLGLGLDYSIAARKLKSSNHVVLDQFELGDKIESADAVKLPLGIGLALLRDRHGVIDLNLPVDGDLDDPKFRFRDALAKVFVNLLEKAVTAPLSLLQSVVSSKEPLDSVAFVAGEFELAPAAHAKLKMLTAALGERPRLRLGIAGISAEEDAPVLKEQRLVAAVEAQQA
ncbi:MAG: hypothetical protein ACI8W8_002018, partial [Rhodothermales bacterium]